MLDFDIYSITQIFDWLDSVVASCDICSLESIGKSYGGHDLRLIKVSILNSAIKYRTPALPRTHASKV